jgi:hypothetical protein
MNGSSILNKKVLGALVLVVLSGAAVLVWMERAPLLAWYYVRNLAQASQGDREVWVERVATLGEPALGDVLDCLNNPSPACCDNARAVLDKLTAEWGLGDARTVSLALRCGRDFQHMSPEGQKNVLDLAAGWFAPAAGERGNAGGLVPPCSRLLAEAVATKDADVQAHALELCGVLIKQPQGNEALSSGRELVRVCLASDKAAVRVQAVQLTMNPGMDLLEQVAALLGDPAVEVRRCAILAVDPENPAGERVLDDVLLPSLHDPDEEVRDLCEAVLLRRGRTPRQIQLGRLLKHPNPVERIQVVDLLLQAPDLDPGLSLRLLSHDPSPAIRAAAIRAIRELSLVQLNDRINEMSQSDPSPTVVFLARRYLAAEPR